MMAGASGRLLGVDVGARRIGVAVSEGAIAVPLTIITHTNRVTDLARIVELAERERAAAIVVGLPVSLDGREHEQARLTRRFGEQLAACAPIPVVFHDERYSTITAQAASDMPGAPAPARRGRSAPPRRRKPIDDRAAAVILQSYIDAGKGRS